MSVEDDHLYVSFLLLHNHHINNHTPPPFLQRPAWPTFFDDMNAIIFLAPVSCFNERLSEDPSVKRLDDSINLWHMICNNKLLRNTQLICFLNKTDLLKEKLARGVKFVEFMPNYGERPNDVRHVTECKSPCVWVWVGKNLAEARSWQISKTDSGQTTKSTVRSRGLLCVMRVLLLCVPFPFLFPVS